MTSRKIYLVSPREPSGATWLINCLLELGIKTYRLSPAGMWHRESGDWLLNPHEELLKKWLPALVDHPKFRFREDVEVQWMHQWFTAPYAGNEVLYFVRDPRDALYSRYKREAPEQSYAEFVAFPDVHTLLDKANNWRLFTAAWLTHPRASVLRFEDYKADALATLTSALDSLQLRYSDAQIERAAQASTFERAAAAERAYRAAHPEDTQVINRSGRPMEWQTGDIDKRVVDGIEQTCGKLLERFGYPRPPGAAAGPCLAEHVGCLSFLRAVQGIEQAARDSAGGGHDALADTLSNVASLDAAQIARARLPDHELRQLRASVREFLQSAVAQVDQRYAMAIPAPRQSERIAAALRRVRGGLSRRVRRLLSHET